MKKANRANRATKKRAAQRERVESGVITELLERLSERPRARAARAARLLRGERKVPKATRKKAVRGRGRKHASERAARLLELEGSFPVTFDPRTMEQHIANEVKRLGVTLTFPDGRSVKIPPGASFEVMFAKGEDVASPRDAYTKRIDGVRGSGTLEFSVTGEAAKRAARLVGLLW